MESWLSLIPPLLVIGIAAYTKKVINALIVGIISAALLVTNGNLFKSLMLITHRLAQETNLDVLLQQSTESPDHLYTFAFLIFLGVIIGLVTHTGGLKAYSVWLNKKLHNAKQSQLVTLALSCLFFLDDYLNCLTVGAIMQPITDSFRIPRVKLAYILDTLSGPLCVLVPATSWVATVLTQLQVLGITNEKSSFVTVAADSFFVYLYSMPFFIYPITAVLSTLFVILNKISYGPMHKQELIAKETGNLFGGKEPLNPPNNVSENINGHIIDFFFPVILFISLVLFLIAYLGNWIYLGGTNNFIQVLQKINMLKILFISSLTTVILSVIFVKIREKLNLNKLGMLFNDSWNLMKTSFLVLILAWTFSSLLKNDLGTGAYLTNSLLSSMPHYFVPLMVFLTTMLISAATGSAWGAMTVIIPLGIPLALQNIVTPTTLANATLLAPTIGALISGAVAGGHISSISDATVIAATSTGSYHFDHYTTQLAYVIPVVISSCVGFIILGFTLSFFKAIAGSILLSLGSIWLINRIYIYKQK